MHDLGFKFNSKERPGLSGNRFFEIKKITFSSGHKPFKKALHIVTTVEKFTFCGLMSLFFFDFCKGRIYPTEVMHY